MIIKRIIIIGLGVLLCASLMYNIHQKREYDILNNILLNKDKTITEMTDITDIKDKQLEELNATVNDLLKQLEDKDAEIDKLKEEAEVKNSVSNARGISLSTDEVDMLARLVEAEAGIEPYEGKVAVANVVLNRIKDSRYPDTLEGVIYQPYQFSGVSMMYDGRPIGDDCYRAVEDALNGYNPVADCISFWADYLDQSSPLWNLSIKYKIGGHVFSDEY